MNGSLFAQMVVSREVLIAGVTITLSVLIVSQPPVVFLTVSVLVPAAVNTWPNHVNGSLFAQIVVSLDVLRAGVTTTVNVLIVSQPPVVFLIVSVLVPAAVNTWPNQVNGSLFAQIVVSRDVVIAGVTITLNVLIVSQPPVVFLTVSVLVPAAVNT